MKTITNHDIQPDLLRKLFTREQLRRIAREQNIPRGRNACDTAKNICAATQKFQILFCGVK